MSKYKPEHGESNPTGGSNSRNEAGFGATDGIQSEADKGAPGLGEREGGSGYRVRTGWTPKTRWTGKFNEA